MFQFLKLRGDLGGLGVRKGLGLSTQGTAHFPRSRHQGGSGLGDVEAILVLGEGVTKH